MIKIQISGGSNSLVSALVSKALINAGIGVSHWTDCKPNEVAKCLRDAKAEGKQVTVIAMTDASK